MTDEDRLLWLAERRTGIGASDVPAIVGESRWGSPWSVWAEKVGLVPIDDSDQTDAQRLGHDLEPVIGRWFTRKTGLYVAGEQRMVRHPVFGYHFATLDGQVYESPAEGDDEWGEPLGVFEAKTTAEKWAELPEYVRVQVQWQMWVTNADRTWVAAMQFPFGRVRFDVFTVERDQALIVDELVPRVERFWHDHVLTGHMPPIDDHPATFDAVHAAWGDLPTAPGGGGGVIFDYQRDLVDEFRALRTEKAGIKKRLARVEAEIKAHFGEVDGFESEGTIGGQTVVSWRSQPRTDIDAAAVRADHGTRYDRHTTIRVLRPHTPKATPITATDPPLTHAEWSAFAEAIRVDPETGEHQ